MIRFLTICAFVFLLSILFTIEAISSNNTGPKFSPNSESKFKINNKNPRTSLEINIDSTTKKGKYKVILHSRSEAKFDDDFNFLDPEIREFVFEAKGIKETLTIILLVKETAKKSLLKFQIIDSNNLTTDDWEIKLTKGFDETPYEKAAIHFSLGAIFLPEAKKILEDKIYFDIKIKSNYFNICEKWNLDFSVDAGFKSTSFALLQPTNSIKPQYTKEFLYGGNKYQFLTFNAAVDKELLITGYQTWITHYIKHTRKNDFSTFTISTGFDFEFRKNNILLTNTVVPIERLRLPIDNTKDTILINPFTESFQRNTYEINYGLGLDLQLEYEEYFYHLKYVLSQRNQHGDTFSVNNIDATTKNNVFTPYFLLNPDYTVVNFVHRLNLEFLDKIYGFKFGIDVRQFDRNSVGFEYNIYLAKEFSMIRLGQIITDVFGSKLF